MPGGHGGPGGDWPGDGQAVPGKGLAVDWPGGGSVDRGDVYPGPAGVWDAVQCLEQSGGPNLPVDGQFHRRSERRGSRGSVGHPGGGWKRHPADLPGVRGGKGRPAGGHGAGLHV